METIDTYFRYCAQISKDYQRTKRAGEITYVKNVFEDPYRMLKFQSLLTKWESCQNSKPGIMSLKIPYWTAEIIADEILDLSEHDSYKNESEFYYFYHNNTCMETDTDNLISNNCVLPHTDPNNDRSYYNNYTSNDARPGAICSIHYKTCDDWNANSPNITSQHNFDSVNDFCSTDFGHII